jgi:predicted PurR-regulated permease PerM
MEPAPEFPATRPGLPRLVILLVSLAAGFLVVAGLRDLSGIVGPVFLALVLVIATQPMRTAAERHGIPGWVAGVVAIVTIYLVLIGLTLAMTLAVANFATLLPSYEDEANQMLDSVVAWLAAQGVGEDQVQRLMSGLDLGRLVQLAGSLASGLLNVLTSLFLVITLVLFMVADTARFSEKLRRLPTGHAHFVEALTSFGIATRRYLVVSTVFGLVVAVLDTIALAWLGVPAALLWGLLAFITNYIPNVGFVIGLVPPAIIGLLEGGPRLMIYVIVVYSVLNVLIQSVLQPKIVGDAVGLSSTITMVSLVFWAYTLGTVGALMAVPLSLFAKAVLVDADPGSHWLIPLISGAAPGKPAWKHSPGAPKARQAPKAPAAPPREEAR